jgi:hypothetical protein
MKLTLNQDQERERRFISRISSRIIRNTSLCISSAADVLGLDPNDAETVTGPLDRVAQELIEFGDGNRETVTPLAENEEIVPAQLVRIEWGKRPEIREALRMSGFSVPKMCGAINDMIHYLMELPENEDGQIPDEGIMYHHVRSLEIAFESFSCYMLTQSEPWLSVNAK